MSKKTNHNNLQTSKIEYSFNLVDKEWIPVLMDTGEEKNVSLNGLYDEAEHILYIRNTDNIYVVYAIHLFLETIIYVAYSRNTDTLLMADDGDFVYHKDVILDYLEQNKKYFDLYDKEYPFMQVKKDVQIKFLRFHNNKKPNEEGIFCDDDIEEVFTTLRLQKKDTNPLENMSLLNASKTKLSQWCDTPELLDDWIARQLLAFRFWHPRKNAGGSEKWNSPKHIAEGMFYIPFSIGLMKGKNLIDSFMLNTNCNLLIPDMRPVWEDSLDEEFDYIKNRLEAYNKKDSSTKEDRYSLYFNPFKEVDGKAVDIARILTYSNILVHIDPETKEYNIGSHQPIRLSDYNSTDKDGNPTWERLKHTLNIFRSGSSYSIQKEILSQDDESYLRVKDVSLVQSPKLNNMTKVEKVFLKPLSIIGKGLLTTENTNSSEEEISEERGRFSEFCGELESIEKMFKRIQYKNKDKLVSFLEGKSNKKRRDFFLDFISDCSSYAEQQLTRLKLLYKSIYNPNDEEERWKDILDNRRKEVKRSVYAKYKKAYEQYIKDWCPEFYFYLNPNEDLYFGASTMRNEIIMKEITKEFQSYIDQEKDNLVALREMREGRYLVGSTLSNNRYYYTWNESKVGGNKLKYKDKAIEYALSLWANHQHSLSSDENANYKIQENEIGNTLDYKYTFGNLLYCLSEKYKESEWEKKMDKYNKSSYYIEDLIRFMSLVIQEAIKSGIKFQLSYGRIAYFFMQILEDPDNRSCFLNDNLEGYFIARREKNKVNEN